MRASFTSLARMLLIALALLPPHAQATTRLVLSLEDLIANSPLIFTGTAEEIVISEDNGVVYSTVRFEIEDVIKGEAALTTIELRFVGGTSTTAQTEVSGQFIPRMGADGLWFVDDTSRTLVNPLTGWSQGYFPIVTKPDGTRWLDLQDHPDYAILAPAAPLAGKMRAFNFPEQQIETQFPRILEYPLDDFIVVIETIEAQGAE